MISSAHHGRFRRALSGLAAMLFAALPIALMSQGASAGQTAGASAETGVPVERQAYVFDGPFDPYEADPTTIHVGVRAGEEIARSYVRLALDRMPKGALVGNLSLTLHVTQSAEASKDTVFQTYNVNSDAAILQACVLTAVLPEPFDKQNPPAYDCAHGSTVAVKGEGDAWNFDLTPLVKAWSVAGNTGAAIIATTNEDPMESWTISFHKARATSEASYRLPPSTGGGGTKPPPPPTTGGPGFYPVPNVPPGPYPFPTEAPVAPPVASIPPVPVQGGGEVALPPIRGPRSSTWMWVLPACLAAAGLILAASRSAVFAGTGSLLSRLRIDFGRRPRSYALASVTAVWAVLFATYSVVIAPPLISRTGQAPPGTALGPGTSEPGKGGSAAQPGPGVNPIGPGAKPGYGGVPTLGPNPGGGGAGAQGATRTLGNINVFYPADGGPPVAQLYSGADDTIGIDYQNKRIKLCGHAAMTYGPAFDIGEEDLKVFWQYINAKGGVNGWKFDFTLVDDGYDPGKAVKAAQKCKDSGAFLTLGGIGFDQIPAVRQWAEQNRQLYIHHIVTEAGSRGLKYSFTALPSEEKMGQMFGRLAVEKFRGKKVGIIWRQSPNWQSGHDLFVKTVKAAGMEIVGDYPVTLSQGNYTQEIARLNQDGNRADVVFAWENALSTVEMIQQAQSQQFFPAWLVFPFNLETKTLGESSFSQPLYGVAGWDAYVNKLHTGAFAEYAQELKEFEGAYQEFNPDADLNGMGGDLLFLAWQGYKGLADLFAECGPSCTRNKMAGALLTYKKVLGQSCEVDFTRGDHHHGGHTVNMLEVFRTQLGTPGWRPIHRCRETG